MEATTTATAATNLPLHSLLHFPRDHLLAPRHRHQLQLLIFRMIRTMRASPLTFLPSLLHPLRPPIPRCPSLSPPIPLQRRWKWRKSRRLLGAAKQKTENPLARVLFLPPVNPFLSTLILLFPLKNPSTLVSNSPFLLPTHHSIIPSFHHSIIPSLHQFIQTDDLSDDREM